MAAALLLAGLAAPGPAGAQTADEAITRYREVFKPTTELDCPKPRDGDDIVVCGRRGPGAPAIPFEREPGEVVRHINEPRSAASLVSGCVMACPPAFGVTDKGVRKFVGDVLRLIRD